MSEAFNTGLVPPGPHRVLWKAIEAAEALPEGQAATLRMAGAEIPVPRFGPQPPTRDSTGATGAMALYAGQSAGAVREVAPAAAILADLRPVSRTAVALGDHDWLSRITAPTRTEDGHARVAPVSGTPHRRRSERPRGARRRGRAPGRERELRLRLRLHARPGRRRGAGHLGRGARAAPVRPEGREPEAHAPLGSCPFKPEDFLLPKEVVNAADGWPVSEGAVWPLRL